MRRLVPYPTLAGDVTVEITGVRLDDVPLPYDMISSSQRTVALHLTERENWRVARLSLRMRSPRRELGTGPWREVAHHAVASERRTNTRFFSPLEDDGDGVWTGTIELDRDRHIGHVNVSGQITATVGDVPGRVIGRVESPWTVDLRAKTPARDDAIRTTWVDFTDEGLPHLHEYRKEPWIVETSGREPLIYLNRGFEGLEAILTHARASDREARDSIASQIAKDAWIALFDDAVSATAIGDDDELERPGGWRDSVLRRMLPEVHPELSLEDGLRDSVNRRRSGEGCGDLNNRIRRAASTQARVPRRLGAMIRSTRRSSEENR